MEERGPGRDLREAGGPPSVSVEVQRYDSNYTNS